MPDVTHKLVHLRASQINGCSVCVDMHARELKEAGETDERIFAVAAWRETPYFTEAERAALALTEAVTRLADRADPVPDTIWDEAARHYDETALAALSCRSRRSTCGIGSTPRFGRWPARSGIERTCGAVVVVALTTAPPRGRFHSPRLCSRTIPTSSRREVLLDIKGKTAIVTGASSDEGIGTECAKILASRGCNVIVNYASNKEGGEAVVAACKAAGADALAVQGDVSKDADCHRLVQAAIDKWGRLDVLVNNAATTNSDA